MSVPKNKELFPPGDVGEFCSIEQRTPWYFAQIGNDIARLLVESSANDEDEPLYTWERNDYNNLKLSLHQLAMCYLEVLSRKRFSDDGFELCMRLKAGLWCYLFARRAGGK